MHPLLLNHLNSCKDLKSFKKIHALLLTLGIVFNHPVINKTVDFFAKSPDFLAYACKFLKHFSHCHTSTFPFNNLISQYAAVSENPQTAFLAYKQTVRNGFSPDVYTFPAVLKSCAKFAGIREGNLVHVAVIKMGFVFDLYVQNSLVYFYSACGEIGSGGKVFDEMLVRDVVSWTGIVSGCVRAGLFEEALVRFKIMNIEPNAATFVSVLVACRRKRFLDVGKGVHGLVYKHTMWDCVEVCNALIDMYVKCECLWDAKRVFDGIAQKDIVSWTSVISGLVQYEQAKEGLELFCDMQRLGVECDRIILTSVLSACASLGALDYGRWVHEYIDRRAMKWDVQIGTAIVDMYAKCGCIELALQTFNGMLSKNVFTWNALLNGLAMHGHAHEAQRVFEEMVGLGVRPNEVTFLAILTACCHSGLVNEGKLYFCQMTNQQYKLSPRLEHYGCMVDLLCRAGLLGEALELIKVMPMSPDVQIVGAILGACKASGNVKLSQEILDHLAQLESHDSGVFVLLSNIYATSERWADVRSVRKLMKKKGIKKAPGSSVIEVDGKAHEFLVGDTSHSHNEDIYILLKFLTNHILLEGHHKSM